MAKGEDRSIDAHLLARIAEALDRLAPAAEPPVDLVGLPGYGWDGSHLTGYARIAAQPLELLRGIDNQRETVAQNVLRHAGGAAAHDMLLWGARGMGKSALVRAAVEAARDAGHDIALVQARGDALATLPDLFDRLRSSNRRFIVFLDDLGFDDEAPARALRSLLEGGVMARPPSIRIAATSNRRAILSRDRDDQPDPLNPRDEWHDRLALADRFGLSIGFHECSQDDYLDIIAGYADHHGLAWDEAEALGWSRRRGARSGRVAHHYIVELAGRAGRAID